MIDIESLPREIRESNRGVVWRYILSDGKRIKVPFIAARPDEFAKSTDPSTWGPFTDALDTFHDGKADGPGFVLGDGYAGVDLDKCRDPDTGAISPDALAIIREFNSYTEISPSQTGVKIFIRGTLPPGGRKKGNIEMYCKDRYFTVTGQRLPDTPMTLEERTPELAALHAAPSPKRESENTKTIHQSRRRCDH